MRFSACFVNKHKRLNQLLGVYGTNWNYLSDRHIHIGYYENGHDVEAIAFQDQSTNSWDMFFNDSYDPGLFGLNVPRDNHFGVKIFSEMNEDRLELRFHLWVENVLIPYRASR